MWYFTWKRRSGMPIILCNGCASGEWRKVTDSDVKSRLHRHEIAGLPRENHLCCDQCGITIKFAASKDPLFDM